MDSNTMDASSSFPSTSIPEHPKPLYDIFINHRGSDVKKTFASHLYNRLNSIPGLRVFLDKDELERGEGLSSQIKAAIAGASVHIAIFSPAYAESRWCLDELVWMVKSGKPIIPVFYGVKPAELRWTRSKDEDYANVLRTLRWWPRSIGGIFAKIPRIFGWRTQGKYGVYEQALLNLEKKKTYDPKTNEEKPRYETNTLENWRNALWRVKDISGFELADCNGYEGELVNKIVQTVQTKIRKPPLHVALYPTGLEERVAEVEDLQRVSSENQSGKAQVVGIVGLGGIGKTTLAKEFFNRKRTYYHASSILFDVREAAAKSSLHHLQTQLLRELTQCHAHQICNIDEGKQMLRSYLSSYMMRSYLSSHEALVVLDDVDHTDQLEALLLPLMDVLRSGSLILVTSRNKDVLTGSRIVESSIYPLKGLGRQHSEELFCLHAFDQRRPLSGFEEVVKKFLHACNGLPLSLKVIGALLKGQKELQYWEEVLGKISRVLPSDIRSKLKISYDSLDEEEKEIFLDIACFFVGKSKDTVIRISEGSGFGGLVGIVNLQNKCLVEVDRQNRIRMHDHLRDLGRYLAEKEPPRCLLRLWRPIDNLTPQIVPHQSSVRGIHMVQPENENPLELQNHSVVDMRGLQLLKAEGDCLKCIFTGLQYSRDLIWLCWDNSPHKGLPSWLSIEKLRVLQVAGKQPLRTFWESDDKAPLQLRELIVNVPVSHLPKSLWQLKELEKIELRDQRDMISLSDSFGNLTNLQYLDLSGCSSLPKLPHSLGNLIRLQHLCLAGCSKLQELPHSFGNFTRLEHLSLEGCSKLQELPHSFGNFTRLEYLSLEGCSKLQELPHLFGNFTRLEHLCLARCSELSISQGTLGNITTLVSLDLSFCLKMTELPPQVASQRSLEELNLLGTSLRVIPRDHIEELDRLETLKLGSPFLKMLPGSLCDRKTLKELTLSDCRSLECLPDSVGELQQLTKMEIIRSEIQYLPTGVRKMNNLEFLKVHCTPLLNVPFAKKVVAGTAILTETIMGGLKSLELHETRISELVFLEGICPNLEHLKINQCNDLEEVGALPTSLIMLEMRFCGALTEIRELCGLRKLRQLDISGCSRVEELPSLESLTSLEELRAFECKKLKSIRGLAQLAKLRLLDVKDCDHIEELAGIEYLRWLEFESSGCPKLQVAWEELKQLGVRMPLKEGPGKDQGGDQNLSFYCYANENEENYEPDALPIIGSVAPFHTSLFNRQDDENYQLEALPIIDSVPPFHTPLLNRQDEESTLPMIVRIDNYLGTNLYYSYLDISELDISEWRDMTLSWLSATFLAMRDWLKVMKR